MEKMNVSPPGLPKGNPSPEEENAVAFHAIEQCFVLLRDFNAADTDILLMPDHLKETDRRP
jgi:hypothetical protein